MAHLFSTHNLKAIGGSREILAGINVSIHEGDRVGVLGPNGAGKSTLLNLLTGLRQPDEGYITAREGMRFTHLTQRDNTDPVPAVQLIHPGLEEYEWASNPDIRDIHSGLLADIDITRPMNELSGGQRRRVSLATVLSEGVVQGRPAGVVVLDEPTNHLDVEGVAWLAAHLNKRLARGHGALIVVTHDRWFLDAVCNQVWEVVPGVEPGYGRDQRPGRIEFYEGSYAAYVLARAERARLAQLAEEKRQNLLRKELAWLQRGAPARTSKPRFRVDAAEALIGNEPPPRDEVELVRIASARLGKQVLDLEGVSLRFGDRVIFDDVTWRLAPGQRVGVVGVNGAGKTTLMRLLAGDLQPDHGRVKRGKTVQVATLSQDTHELDEVSHLRVTEAVAQVALSIDVGGKELTASQIVERIGFNRDRAWTPVADISGGERRRLQLVRLLMAQPNVLLLDEPTNDLDTDTLAAMEDLLDSFAGTLVVVSHDRYLLERVTSSQVALYGDGKIVDLPGGVEQYLRVRAGQTTEGAGAVAAGAAAAADAGPSDAQLSREARKEAQRVERQMKRSSQQIEKVEAQLADVSSIPTPNAQQIQEMADLAAQLKSLQSTHEALETQWLEAAQRAEDLS